MLKVSLTLYLIFENGKMLAFYNAITFIFSLCGRVSYKSSLLVTALFKMMKLGNVFDRTPQKPVLEFSHV